MGRENPLWLSWSTSPLEEVAEALRGHPRGSQSVLEVYSPLLLKLVR
jgi:hypothetical protein